MARGKTAKLYRTFVKGLITEAGFLTFPENASTDELNTVLKRKGSRSRRLGIEYEPSSVASPVVGTTDTDVFSEFYWRAVDSDASVNFLCLQMNDTVHFYNADAEPISGDKKSFTIDLTTYKTTVATNDQVATTPIQMASGKGYLFIAQQYIEPLVVEYDADTDTISVNKIIIQMRDFDGVNDGLANDEEPATLDKEHYYNLRNQGWVKPGTLGVVEGAGSANPYTPGSPPASSGSLGAYDPYSGSFISYPEP